MEDNLEDFIKYIFDNYKDSPVQEENVQAYLWSISQAGLPQEIRRVQREIKKNVFYYHRW